MTTYKSEKPLVIYFFDALGNIIMTATIPTIAAICGKYEAVAGDENAVLDSLVPYADSLPPLPAFGEEVEAETIYNNAGTLVKCRQTHTRTEHDPADIPALFLSYQPDEENAEWIENEWVYAGTERGFEGGQYNCIQAHQTLSTNNPSLTIGVLWEIINETNLWVAGEAVVAGDEREYEGVLYVCLQSHTTQAGWTPPVVPALWAVV